MTLVSLPSAIAWPGLAGGNFNSLPAVATAATLDAAGEYMAYALVAREDMVVSHVAWRTGAVAGSPTADVRIETLDPATGLPSGTLWATNTNLVTGTLVSTTNQLSALTASATITRGQVFCVKIAYASGTSIIVANFNQASAMQNTGLPYQISNVGTPTKAPMSNNTPIIGLGSSSTAFYQINGVIPISSLGGGAFNNTNAAKRGLRFTIPMNCRAVGARWYTATSVGDYNLGLYDDTTGTAVELSSSSTAYEGDNNAANLACCTYGFFDSPVVLTAGTTYRLAVEPSSATNTALYALVLPSANFRGATVAGTTAHYTTFVTGGWVDTATDTVPLMDLLIDQLDNGTGSGSGVIGVIGG